MCWRYRWKEMYRQISIGYTLNIRTSPKFCLWEKVMKVIGQCSSDKDKNGKAVSFKAICGLVVGGGSVKMRSPQWYMRGHNTMYLHIQLCHVMFPYYLFVLSLSAFNSAFLSCDVFSLGVTFDLVSTFPLFLSVCFFIPANNQIFLELSLMPVYPSNTFDNTSL